jgi:pimeloyl-ACP methyl ester carboxylesterase
MPAACLIRERGAADLARGGAAPMPRLVFVLRLFAALASRRRSRPEEHPMECHRPGFTIWYETVGDDSGVPLVLVPGLGEQIGSVEFSDEQCDLFVARGFRVVRMDNRDTGLSLPTTVSGEDGEEPAPLYSWWDMADDIAAVVAELGDTPAHLVGASLGGYIIRWAAVRHPDKVASLTVLMSGSGCDFGDPGPQIDPEVLGRLFETLAFRHEADDAIKGVVDLYRWIWGDRYPFEESWVAERATKAYHRSYRPEGVARNFLAGGGAPGLWDAQSSIRCPTLVFHGDQDPIFGLDHAHATAQRIPTSRLSLKQGMGHVVHRELWTSFVNDVSEVASET